MRTVIAFCLLGLCLVGLAQAAEPALNRFAVEKDGKSGYIDRTGRIVIPLQYNSAYGFSEGLAAVHTGGDLVDGFMQGGKWGFIDTTGRLVIDFQFDGVAGFADGMSAFARGDTWGFIDRTGTTVLAPRFSFGMPNYRHFADGLLLAETGDSLCIFDRTGRVRTRVDSTEAEFFAEGRAAARHARTLLWGFIDTLGRPVIPFRYNAVSKFQDGVASVWDTTNNVGLTYFIDRSGATVFHDTFLAAGSFSEGLAAVNRNYLWGYIDRTGKMVVKPQFGDALPFSEGLASVRQSEHQDSKWGYTDRTGKLVIPFQFEGAGQFQGGLAEVRLGTKSGYIDKTGKYVWELSK
jgi:hypothetical protein